MKDRIKGKATEMKGKVTGNKAEELKGKAQQAKGEVEEAAKSAAHDLEHPIRHPDDGAPES